MLHTKIDHNLHLSNLFNCQFYKNSIQKILKKSLKSKKFTKKIFD